MRIQVVYGRHRIDDVVRCPFCEGTGQGRQGPCFRCDGDGQVDPAGVGPTGVGRTYTFDSEPVEIGDIVLCPGNWHIPEPQEATVVALTGSDYDGPIKCVLRVIERVEVMSE